MDVGELNTFLAAIKTFSADAGWVIVVALYLAVKFKWIKFDDKKPEVPTRINGSPCGLHSDLAAKIDGQGTKITVLETKADAHHEEQTKQIDKIERGIERIHARLDDKK